MTREEAIRELKADYCGNRIICELHPDQCNQEECEIWLAIKALETQPEVAKDTNVLINDCISRRVAIDVLHMDTSIIPYKKAREYADATILEIRNRLEKLPSTQPERKWMPCSNPPKHHKDVIVKGIEAIGNVTVHKVMQWDVDTWRPTDYAPSVMWKEWSEI